MEGLKVSIVSYAEDPQPGWVKCVFEDAYGKSWIIEDKLPVITDEDLDANSVYPRDGIVACTITSRRLDSNNREIITIDTSLPWGICAVSGESIFEVFADLVIEK